MSASEVIGFIFLVVVAFGALLCLLGLALNLWKWALGYEDYTIVEVIEEIREKIREKKEEKHGQE